MTFKKLAAALLFAACSLPALAQETLVVYWTKGFYPQEDKALDEMIDKFQKKTGVKVELSRYSPQESVPKAVAALDSGTPPDVAYGDVFDFQVAGKWAAEGRLEDLSDILVPMKANFLPVTLETVYLLLLRLPDEAPDHAYPVLEGHAGGGGLQGVRHSEELERLLELLVRQRAGRLPQEDRQAHLLDRLADGRRLVRLVLLVPHLHGRVQRQGGRRRRQADRRQARGEEGPGRRRQGLCPHDREGLHAAFGRELEGPGQQRRLPQQADHDDAQRDHFDRREVARRLEQRQAHAGAACRGEEELLGAYRHLRLPDETRRQADGVPLGGEGRRDLRERKEQEAREGVRPVRDAGREPDPVRRGRARPLVPGHEIGGSARLLDLGPAPQDRAQPVLGRHCAVRVHKELQVHDPEQRKRVGQGDQPHRQRQVAGGEGGRRDDREDKAGRR